jgi:hypothetical protein
VFFHHGDWPVVEAMSESEFTIQYDELTEDPDCIATPATGLTAVFSGSEQVNGRTVNDFAYTEGLGEIPVIGMRMVCGEVWNDPEPCGLALPGFEMPTPPTS